MTGVENRHGRHRQAGGAVGVDGRQVEAEFQLRGEGFNVLNHTNLGDPNMNLSSSSFGLITGTIGSDFGGARTGQVSARLEF